MRRRMMWLGTLILISLATRWLSLAVDVVDSSTRLVTSSGRGS